MARIMRYPRLFRLPNFTPYGLSVDMGILRNAMDAGNTRQRRKYKNMPTAIKLEFAMTWKQLRAWQNWTNEYAYTWFEMEAISMYSRDGGKDCYPHILRFISDLTIQAMNVPGYCKIDVLAELSPEMFANKVLPLSYDWIVGKTPPDPSPDWHIAGEPGNPSRPSWNIGGTPSAPNSMA
jgi:hypothetical protein